MGITIHDKAPKVYMVTGCHNSATSLLAMALARCGIDIGRDLLPGVYEDWDFVSLNDSILLEAGGSWHDPPSETAIMGIKANNRIDKLLTEREDVGFLAFKDPRLCLTGRHYLDHIDDRDSYLICCFRKPKRVVQSLLRTFEGQGNAEEDFTRAFVDRYNQGLIRLIQAFLGEDT